MRDRGQEQAAGLPGRDVRDVAFVDLQDDPVGVQGRDLEQLLAAADGGADGLAEIAGDDDAVEGRGQLDPGQLLVQQGDLGFGLVDLRLDDVDVCAVPLRQGPVELGQALSACRAPAQALQRKVLVVERRQDLALADDLAARAASVSI